MLSIPLDNFLSTQKPNLHVFNVPDMKICIGMRAHFCHCSTVALMSAAIRAHFGLSKDVVRMVAQEVWSERWREEWE